LVLRFEVNHVKLKAIVFDAYGTLFDVHAAAFTASTALNVDGQVFSNLLRQRQLELTWLRSLMGKYEDFWCITRAALQSTLQELYIEKQEATLERLMQAWLEPPIFPDVLPALDMLRQIPLVVSNGSPEMLESALCHNHLESKFAEIISVNRAKTYKPSPQIYALATDALRFPAKEMLFVSSNWWDAWGAKTFGYTVCWCNRSNSKIKFPDCVPDFEAPRLDLVVDLTLPSHTEDCAME